MPHSFNNSNFYFQLGLGGLIPTIKLDKDTVKLIRKIRKIDSDEEAVRAAIKYTFAV